MSCVIYRRRSGGLPLGDKQAAEMVKIRKGAWEAKLCVDFSGIL